MNILACVDGSPYTGSVCDHAAWLSSRFDLPVRLLHVSAEPEADEVMHWARERLESEGAAGVEVMIRPQDFEAEALALAAQAQVIVMGKRGRETTPQRDALGAHVSGLLHKAQRPICLVSQVYLPIGRGLVLLDANPGHRRAVEFIDKHSGLRNLELDLVLIDDATVDPSEKLGWARRHLGAHEVRIFPLQADGIDAAALAYLQQHGCDLLVVSREVLLDDPQARFAKAAPGSLWSWRTPVLVC